MGHDWGDSLTHPMLISVLHFRSEGHPKPRNEVGFLSLAQCLVGFEPRTFRFLLQRLNPLGHSPQYDLKLNIHKQQWLEHFFILTYFSPVLHFIQEPVIRFAVQIKWLVSKRNATLGWNGLNDLQFYGETLFYFLHRWFCWPYQSNLNYLKKTNFSNVIQWFLKSLTYPLLI